jgi:hypothetical protein
VTPDGADVDVVDGAVTDVVGATDVVVVGVSAPAGETDARDSPTMPHMAAVRARRHMRELPERPADMDFIMLGSFLYGRVGAEKARIDGRVMAR